MIESIIFGLTIGSIFYCFSVGLTITFGTMKIINFAHGGIYALAVYFFLFFMNLVNGNFILALALAVASTIPLGYLVERYIVRSLYGESIDYAVIATYGVLLIMIDFIKMNWGTIPLSIGVPIRTSVQLIGVTVPVYRLLVILVAILVFIGLNIFFKYTMAGKVITAALDDSDGTRSLGIRKSKYFSLVFIIGSVLAALGGVLYGPFSAADPYMGYFYLSLAFAVVIVGKMGNIKGTFYSSFIMGLVVAISARFVPRLAFMMVFLVMALVLVIRRTDP